MRASFNPIATAHSCHAHRHLVNLGRGDNSCPYILCVNIYVYIYMYRTCVCVCLLISFKTCIVGELPTLAMQAQVTGSPTLSYPTK